MSRYATIAIVLLLAAGIVTAQDTPAAATDKEVKAEKPATATEPTEPKAEEKAGAPAPTTAAAEPLKASVVSVTGKAQHRLANKADAVWRPLKVDDELGEMEVIRTGLSSKVVLKFADRGEVTVKSATKVGIASFRKTGTAVRTQVGVKYGAIRASVDSSQGKTDFAVKTPVATLAARGTGCETMFSDFGLGINGLWGLWGLDAPGGSTTVAGGQSGDGNATPSNVLDALANDPQMGDPFGGLTPEEILNLIFNGGGRGIFSFTGNPGNAGPLLSPHQCSNGKQIDIIIPPPPPPEKRDQIDGGNEEVFVFDRQVLKRVPPVE
ncbi:MAG: FecR domain-containing protein [Planctomycetota bacterium]|jgi:hypothetical protein